MRIGIDYTAAARQGGGIGRCTRELVSAILAEQPPHDFALLAGTAGLGDAWSTQARRLRARLPRPGASRLRTLSLTDDWMARLAPVADTIPGDVDHRSSRPLLCARTSRCRRCRATHGPGSRFTTSSVLARHPETFPAKLRAYLESMRPS